jgi:1,4-dihydroxy-6-naphthoate synthase
MNPKITLGFSSCPNDTFIFDAMIHGKVDTEGLEFQLHIADVEELNQMAFEQKLMVTKISFNAFSKLSENYLLLDAGAALGRNCGPLIVAKNAFPPSEISSKSIAIPGIHTTANLLLSIAFPELTNKTPLIFSEIEKSILDEKFDCGLIIHESRFTYEEKGLKKIIDLGEYWEDRTQTQIPLGGIIALRSLDPELLQKINRVLKRSVAFAMNNPKSGIDFIRCHAQEMSEEVMYKHIDLYVNDFSRNLGEQGKAAVKRLFEEGKKLGLIGEYREDLFV